MTMALTQQYQRPAPPTSARLGPAPRARPPPPPPLCFEVDFTFMQGRRPKQEDRHLIVKDLKHTASLLKSGSLAHFPSPCSLFGVFDGHQGALCSEYVCKRFVLKLVPALAKLSPVLVPSRHNKNEEQEQARKKFHAELREMFRKVCHDVDAEWLQKFRTNPDGATAVVSLLFGDELATCWVGDSRAVMMMQQENNNKKQHEQEQPAAITGCAITRDHKPEDPLEKQRVEANGGKVIELGGCSRVAHRDFEERTRRLKQLKAQGLGGGQEREPMALAVSRAFGDREFKVGISSANPNGNKTMRGPLLSATPDVDIRTVAPYSGLMLSCDGVFDVMRNQEVVQFLGKHYPDCRKASGAIVDEAYRRKSGDNLTCITVYFLPNLEVGSASGTRGNEAVVGAGGSAAAGAGLGPSSWCRDQRFNSRGGPVTKAKAPGNNGAVENGHAGAPTKAGSMTSSKASAPPPARGEAGSVQSATSIGKSSAPAPFATSCSSPPSSTVEKDGREGGGEKHFVEPEAKRQCQKVDANQKED